MATASFDHKLTAYLDRATKRRGPLGAPQVLVRTPDGEYVYGDREMPFHVASIGKLPTAVLVMQQIDEGAIRLDTIVGGVLPAGRLDGLFMIDGVDHAGEVTVAQLLDHTSGVADYFEGPTRSGPRVVDQMLSEPDRMWTPDELVDFSRDYQVPVARPGLEYSYSDTGYVLLGLLLESVTGRTFHALLHERLFTPLGMLDSALMLRSEPAKPVRPIAPAYIEKVEVSGFRSVTADWAGGGIVSTLDDLARLSTAFHGGELVSDRSHAHMSTIKHRFRPGIHYGAGLMELRFDGFMPLLRGLPRPTGHMGILGTHLFYDADHDAHIVLNFGSTGEMVRSVRAMIKVEQLLNRGLRPLTQRGSDVPLRARETHRQSRRSADKTGHN